MERRRLVAASTAVLVLVGVGGGAAVADSSVGTTVGSAVVQVVDRVVGGPSDEAPAPAAPVAARGDVLTQLAHLQRTLMEGPSPAALEALPPEVLEGIAANAGADMAALDDLVARAQSGDDVAAVAAEAAEFRPAMYRLLVEALEPLAGLAAEVEAARETYAADTAALTALDEVEAEVDALLARAVTVTARSGAGTLTEVRDAVAAAGEAFAAVVADPPGEQPTEEPTEEPTADPTGDPTVDPTAEPTAEPTPEPTADPTPTSEPTAGPTADPTSEPTTGEPEPLG